MVENPRTSARARGLQRPGVVATTAASGLVPLNAPRPAAVESGSRGEPRAVLVKGVYQRVATIHDTWRVDDEWWRDEVARRYFIAELESGRRLTLYHDLINDAWYIQTYDGPRSIAKGA